MPILDGYSTTKIIKDHISKNELSNIPIIGYTADISEENLRKCKEYGMSDVVRKPSSKENILKIISKYIDINKL